MLTGDVANRSFDRKKSSKHFRELSINLFLAKAKVCRREKSKMNQQTFMWDFPSAVPEILMIDAIDALLEITKDLRINHNSFFS